MESDANPEDELCYNAGRQHRVVVEGDDECQLHLCGGSEHGTIYASNVSQRFPQSFRCWLILRRNDNLRSCSSVFWCIRRPHVILWCSNRVLERCAIIHPVQSGHKLCKWAKKTYTPQQWDDLARSEYPRYTGTADTLVKYKNLEDQLAQWSNVLGLTFSYNSTKNPEASYTKIIYKDESKLIEYSAQEVGHFSLFHEVQVLDLSGLMRVTTTTTTTVATTTTCVTSATIIQQTLQALRLAVARRRCGGSSCTGPTLLSASLGQHAQHRIPTTPSVCEVIEKISRSLMLSPTIWFICLDSDSLQ
ncbi:hypothetical protein BOTCAL_0153g00030 [Botryotinia calthae]|uniref:Uncharacterized protein n=1 Tax=Botryotinia calthae TaxID=38488 RepID=A0A4Y8D4L9_9HELO|nr:hypothetical protein BOTCAL_0153g00030 [Botryotinia calthae]